MKAYNETMKKKILFAMPHLKTGGVATAFLSLLKEISDDGTLDIDIMIYDHNDSDAFITSVNKLRSPELLHMLAIPQDVMNRESKPMAVVRLFFGFIARYIGARWSYRMIMPMCKKLEGYDCAVSFANTGKDNSLYGGCSEYVLKRVRAARKVAFLHSDYLESGINTPYSAGIYRRFDAVAAVSEGVKKAFLTALPELSDKVFVVHNCHDYSGIAKKAAEGTVGYDRNRINMITVARLSREKGQFRMLPILSRLKNDGCDFIWHIVGGAEETTEKEFMRLVSENGLSDNIVLHHNQINPYRFFPNADLMLVPSYHEAAPMVFAEAACLGLPVLTTRTTSAEELVSSKGLGAVCENTDDGIYSALKKLLTDKNALPSLRSGMRGYACSNDTAVEEFYKAIGKGDS